MIPAHQPTIFGAGVVAALSSQASGNMKFGIGDDTVTLANRDTFLKQAGIPRGSTSLVYVRYTGDNFTRYRIANENDKALGMPAPHADIQPTDAMVVTRPQHALFLPLADCAGAILYDPVKRILMVSHLGRHSVEQFGAQKSVEYLVDQCRSTPSDILVWISPSVGNATYPLWAFDGRSLRQVIMGQFRSAGILAGHIQASDIDTATHADYFSHSEFLKGDSKQNGRFAIVAMMTAQGEPAVY
jgi:copper oxidase (laccase) domain-containing protein